jgi:PAS domain S-box-containing protein
MTALPQNREDATPSAGDIVPPSAETAQPGDPAIAPSLPPCPPEVAAELQRLRQEVAQLSLGRQAQTAAYQSTAIALERDEEFIRALLNNLSEAIVACDGEGRLMVYNASACRLLALPATPSPHLRWNQYCTLHLAGVTPPLAPEDEPLRRAYRGESIQDFEMDIHQAGGQVRTVLVNGDPIRNASGDILGAVVALRDITPFRETTAALQEREAFLRSIYNGLKAAIFVVDVGADHQFHYIGINTAYEQLTGLTSHSIQGKTPEEILPPDIAAATLTRYRECVTAERPITYEEAMPLQGQSEWWLTTLTPLVSDQGRIYRLIGTSLNITRRRAAETRVQQLNADLEQRVADRTQELTQINHVLLQTTTLLEKRNYELDQFVYVASHDLKAPLRAIANLSAWIEEDLEGQLPEENQEQLQLLRGRVNRMEALINGLLEYSRVGRKEFPAETVNIQQLVAEVLDSLDPPPNFTITVAPDLPTFTAKGLLLHQVFSNLISNALKYINREDGEITIAWSDLGDRYCFSVTDNGPGIDPRYHNKVFAVFQVLQARDEVESTGIGLAIVKKIIESEGGTIEIESDLGQGATFRFTWPCFTPGAT